MRRRRERELEQPPRPVGPTRRKRHAGEGLPQFRLMAALRWGTTALALVFIGLVLICPHVQSEDRLVRLFADDVVLRRVSVASAIGLIVTANIFFRPRGRTDSEFDEYLRRADPD